MPAILLSQEYGNYGFKIVGLSDFIMGIRLKIRSHLYIELGLVFHGVKFGPTCS